MKIAISATSPSLDAEVDPRFGRCQYFIIVDPQTLEFEAAENTNIMASGGAGIASAQMVANKEVQAVLTGNCGPNAYQALEAAGVQVITGVAGKIRDAIEGYKAGRFQAASQSTGDAHSGMGGMGMGGGMGRGRGGGKGMGRGMGRGMGARMMPSVEPPQPPTSGHELETLISQVQMLGQQLNEILRRLEKLEQK